MCEFKSRHEFVNNIFYLVITHLIFVVVRDSKNQIQQSGGLLIAAGLDGGDTIVAVHSRTAT